MKSAILSDPNNARVHDKHNKETIRYSLKELGAGRSICIDAENVIIAGNGVYEEAQALGVPIRIIDSDGSELIAIRRTDLQSADAKRKALAIADNRANDLSFFDEHELASIFDEINPDDALQNAIGFSAEEINDIIAGANCDYEDLNKESTPDVVENTAHGTMCVIGPYRFPISRSLFEAWHENVRQNVGFDKGSIVAEIKRRLELL